MGRITDAFENLLRPFRTPEAVPQEQQHKLNKTQDVVVSLNYHYMPMRTCPVGAKVILLGDGVGIVGSWNGRDKFWRGWAPMPKIIEEYLL